MNAIERVFDAHRGQPIPDNISHAYARIQDSQRHLPAVPTQTHREIAFQLGYNLRGVISIINPGDAGRQP